MAIHQEMMLAKQATMAQSQVGNKNQKQKIRKGYDGLLEWILERDGHEFLVDVDRQYIRDTFNQEGICEKFVKDLNIPNMTTT